MLTGLVEKLDAWAVEENLARRREGAPHLPNCCIRLVGQMALFEARIPLTLVATNDVDVLANYSFSVEREFRRLVEATGKRIDATSAEIWMPQETRYDVRFEGELVRFELADVDAVLLSKALKAAEKNGPLIVEYLAKGASERFFELTERYELDLGRFL